MSLKGYSILEGDLPDQYRRSYNPYLFHKPAHLALQSQQPMLHYFYVDLDKQKCLGEIHFSIIDSVVVSPLRAPFGGFMLSNAIALQQVFDFVDLLVEDFLKKNISKVNIKSFPENYDKQKSDFIIAALTATGFVAQVELSAIVDVRTDPTPMMDSEERKWITKNSEMGFVVKREPIANLEIIYNLIARIRKEKDYKLSMTYTDLLATVNEFQKDFFLFGLYHQEELIGGAITIAVDGRILYTFLYDSLDQFKKQSPAVLMLHRIYEFARRYQFEMVDLGTSTVDGRPMFTLLDFKRHMGAQLCQKHTFEKILG